MRDGKILFRFLGLLSACLGLFEILRGAPLPALELPDSITTRRLPRVLGYGLLYKRFFTCYQWMMTNLLQIQGVIYSSQAGSTLVKVIVTLATIHACNEFCDVLKYSSLLVSQTFVSLSDRSFIFVFNYQCICCYSRRYSFNQPCLLQKADS